VSNSPAISTEHLSKLRWRSRRGTQELDLLLMRYLTQRAPSAEAGEIAEFERLLACEDRELQRWFLAYAPCPDAELSRLVDAIRALPIA
jgi:antitoxin CptB